MVTIFQKSQSSCSRWLSPETSGIQHALFLEELLNQQQATPLVAGDGRFRRRCEQERLTLAVLGSAGFWPMLCPSSLESGERRSSYCRNREKIKAMGEE
jgi:hypothetical protein